MISIEFSILSWTNVEFEKIFASIIELFKKNWKFPIKKQYMLKVELVIVFREILVWFITIKPSHEFIKKESKNLFEIIWFDVRLI